MLNIFKLKKVLSKNFDGQRIYISTKGPISMNYFIDDTKVIVNSKRVIIGSSTDNDFIIDLYLTKKISIDKSQFKIIFYFDDLEVELQV